MTPTSPHITAERRLIRHALVLCLSSGLAIVATASNLLGAGVLWCWLGLFVLVMSAAAGGLEAVR
jgi:hypothetical protein